MAEFIHNFGIDWKLLAAQVINFAILLFVLKRFAFKPLMRMLKTRQDEIEKGITLTRDAEALTERMQKERQDIMSQARGEALGIVEKAGEDAGDLRSGILKDAGHEAEKIMNEAKRRLEEEKEKMKDDVYKDTRELVHAATIRVLGKMSPGERDEQLIEEALRELKATYR